MSALKVVREERRGDTSWALEVRGVAVSYGNIRAVQELDLRIDAGITALVGANGAGKSSLVKAVAGVVPLTAGTLACHGRDVTRVPAHRRLHELGVVLVPEGRGVIPEMTVLENLSFGLRAGRTRSARRLASAPDAGELEPLLDMFPALAGRLQTRARLLSGGEQQMLSLARALACAPRILLIDEPSLGLSPAVVVDLLSTIRRVAERDGISVLLIEQDTRAALEAAEYCYVMERGRIVAEGAASDLASSALLRAAYLGGPAGGAES